MIRERRTPRGKVRYKIEVMVNGVRCYGYAHSLEEAQAKETALKQQRRSRHKVESMDFLRRAWRV